MLLECVHIPNSYNLCKLCGIKLYADSQSFKTNNFKSHIYNVKLKSPPCINYELNYLEIRESLIDYLQDMQKRLFFSDKTFHLAIHILDSTQSINANPKLRAAISLFISAKYNENDTLTPGFRKIQKVSEMDHPISEYKQLEVQMLKTLNWELNASTLYDIVQMYLSYGVVFSTDHLDEKSLKVVCQHISKCYSQHILKVIKECSLLGIDKNILGMAIILYIRKLNNIHPLFPQQLQQFIIDTNKLIETYGIICNFLDSKPYKQTLISCRSLPPTTRIKQGSQPPVSRPPLQQINNIIPKQIKQKHMDNIVPFNRQKSRHYQN